MRRGMKGAPMLFGRVRCPDGGGHTEGTGGPGKSVWTSLVRARRLAVTRNKLLAYRSIKGVARPQELPTSQKSTRRMREPIMSTK